MTETPTVPLALLSEALDEIYELRRALAYEALARSADLELRSFPKSRRGIAVDAVERMQAAARGKVAAAYSGQESWAMRSALRAADAPETLTRTAWENEKPRRSNS